MAEFHADYGMDSACNPCQNQWAFHWESVAHYILMGICSIVYTINYCADSFARGYEIHTMEIK